MYCFTRQMLKSLAKRYLTLSCSHPSCFSNVPTVRFPGQQWLAKCSELKSRKFLKSNGVRSKGTTQKLLYNRPCTGEQKKTWPPIQTKVSNITKNPMIWELLDFPKELHFFGWKFVGWTCSCKWWKKRNVVFFPLVPLEIQSLNVNVILLQNV